MMDTNTFARIDYAADVLTKIWENFGWNSVRFVIEQTAVRMKREGNLSEKMQARFLDALSHFDEDARFALNVIPGEEEEHENSDSDRPA